MQSQLFKKDIPATQLIHFLKEICQVSDKYFIFDNATFKRGVLQCTIQPFIESIRPYYFSSKLKYLDRRMTYSSLCTIIRQICKFNDIKYLSKIRYNKSSYDIVYYIYCAD